MYVQVRILDAIVPSTASRSDLELLRCRNLTFFVLGRDQPATSTHSTPERHSTLASVGQMLARLLVQASLRTEGSRSQNLIRAASMKSLPRPVTPSPGATPALSSRGLAALLAPIAFRCPNASMTNCRAPASFMSVSQPWSDKMIATASNNCDGEPASCPAALRTLPPLSWAPPPFGATRKAVAPSFSIAFCTALISAPSDPSA